MMKGGLMKGLRYISQIFEAKEEDEEEDAGGIHIGFPTDVKHVAHIGMDGPTVTPPTWMNDYQSDIPTKDSAANSPKSQDKKRSDRGMKMNSPGQDKTSKDQTEANSSELPMALPLPPTKASRRHASASTLAFQSSTPTESAAVPRHSRRNKSTEDATFEPLEQDKSARRGARKHNRVKENESGSDAAHDTSLVPKPRRKKKSTRSASEDGSGRLSAKTDLGPDQ